ncbi:RraA family protein [Oceanobacillus sp. FSL W7-1304]|uniref:RraA family protein n=1 Tax=Oceanobacillus sp. FSL W7-1304 TaxID=2975322 RepID=UPI0030D702E2
MTTLPDRLSDGIIERAKLLNSTLVSDAMGCAGAMDYSIKSLTGIKRIVGTATTVIMKPGDNLYLHQAIYNTTEGYVIVADGKSHTKNAYLGELMAYAAKAMGVSGIIIDGCIRDKGVLETLDFPIFAKGFVSNGPFKDGPGEINVPISCGGVTVNPGDLVIGDEDGVVIVPKNKIQDVFEKAEKKLKYERERVNVINKFEKSKQSGEKLVSLEPSWLREKIKNL